MDRPRLKLVVNKNSMFFYVFFCWPAAGFDSSCEPPARFMAQTWVGSKLGLDGMHAIDEKDKLVLGRIQNLDSKYFLSLWLFWLRHSWHKNTIFFTFSLFSLFVVPSTARTNVFNELWKKEKIKCHEKFCSIIYWDERIL